jgi:ribosome biogenesis GTPase / thiamine phosphate phosphatase
VEPVFLGRVIRAQSRRFDILGEHRVMSALVPKRLRFENPEWVDPVAVGDTVEASLRREEAVIQRVLPRRNQLVRRAMGGRKRQLLAANVDRVVIVLAAMEPAWKPATLDRQLVLASSAGIPPLVWINKSDLVPEPLDDDVVAVYTRIGIPVLRGSALTGAGLEELSRHLRDTVTVFVGASGVGKSSLVNRLIPGTHAPVGDMSLSTGKGTHTTSWIEMHDLPGGGQVIDGPGLRVLDLTDVTVRDLARHFPEIEALIPLCRFPDCSHLAEPSCAVKAGVASGLVGAHRYDSYRRIYESLDRGEG